MFDPDVYVSFTGDILGCFVLNELGKMKWERRSEFHILGVGAYAPKGSRAIFSVINLTHPVRILDPDKDWDVLMIHQLSKGSVMHIGVRAQMTVGSNRLIEAINKLYRHIPKLESIRRVA